MNKEQLSWTFWPQEGEGTLFIEKNQEVIFQFNIYLDIIIKKHLTINKFIPYERWRLSI